MKDQFVRVDSSNRVCLKRILKKMPEWFSVCVEGNMITLEPVRDRPENGPRSFESENCDKLESIKKRSKVE